MNNLDGYLDTQLISLYLKYGDDEAFSELLRRYDEMLNYFAGKVHLAGYDEEDVRQMLLMTFLSAMKNYDIRQRASFRTFVQACLKNCSAQLIRDSLSKRRNPDYIVSYSDCAAVADERVSYDDSHVTSGLIEKEVREVMEKILSKQEYMIFTYYTLGFSYNELAEKFEMSRKQVDNAICRARKKLCNYFEKTGQMDYYYKI